MVVMFSRFVDDIISFVKKKVSIKFALDTLNNFHKNIKFTFEVEIVNSIFRCSMKESLYIYLQQFIERRAKLIFI